MQRAVRRTAAGSTGSSSEPCALRINQLDRCDDDDGTPDGSPTHALTRRWRRAIRIPGSPSLFIGAGILIWLSCLFIIDDPFSLVTPIAGPSHSRTVDGATKSLSMQAQLEGLKASSNLPSSHLSYTHNGSGSMGVHDSNLVVGNNSHTVQWSHSANLTVPSSRKVIANKSIQTKWAASATMASILFGDVNSKNASGGLSAALGFSGSHANTSNVLLLRGAERLRETRAILQKQGEARMRSKRNELNQKGEQVRSGSVALANAISSGKVQKRVVVGVVAAFLLCAALLQILAAARGKLRQAVQVLVTRSLRTAPAPNELLTRPYATWPELTVRVSLDFVNEPANLMLISIGSLQVLATWSKANWWHCKKVNLLVLLLNFAYTLVQEVRAQVLAARHDSAWNLTECTLVSPSGTPEPVLAKDINVGDCIRLQHGDLCPATGELVSTSHTYILFNTLCETGEDCCSILAPGDLVLRGFYLSLEHSEVVICVTETRNGVGNPTDCTGISKPPSDELVPSKSRRMQRFPEHMNRPLAQVNLIALALLFCASALVGALCYLPSGAAALN